MTSSWPATPFPLRLFPLPSLVFFPGTRLPLHVFEPRYRQLVSDAIESDNRIGIVLLREGWEGEYYASPAVHGYATMGEIEKVVKLEDGRFHILLRGEVRVRILEEPSLTPYRTASVVAAPEAAPDPVEAWAQRAWLTELAQRYLEVLPGSVDVPELETATLESLANALSMSLGVDAAQKQKLLELGSLLDRCREVGTILEQRLMLADFLQPFRRDGDPSLN